MTLDERLNEALGVERGAMKIFRGVVLGAEVIVIAGDRIEARRKLLGSRRVREAIAVDGPEEYNLDEQVVVGSELPTIGDDVYDISNR